jgi:NAD(P)-dependent dehydrogenase (short-subunit alcohol dehydrogenase family)
MFQTPFSDRIRNEAKVATMAVGNIFEPDHVNSILMAGRADLVLPRAAASGRSLLDAARGGGNRGPARGVARAVSGGAGPVLAAFGPRAGRGGAGVRRVLVTGGGSGIGRAVARAFAGEGDAVTIAGRRREALEETADGFAMDVRVADVTDEAQVAALFDAPFDVVVANAGSGKAARLKDTSLEVWNDTLAVNLTGVFLTFRAAYPAMGPGGRLIAIASTASLKGGPAVAAYAAAKHGVLGLVRSLALEVAKSGITVNAVCPGYVDTPLTDKAVAGLMARKRIGEAEATAMVTGGNPLGRLISTEEVVAAVMFLASASASMVNGHALAVTGGEI